MRWRKFPICNNLETVNSCNSSGPILSSRQQKSHFMGFKSTSFKPDKVGQLCDSRTQMVETEGLPKVLSQPVLCTEFLPAWAKTEAMFQK